MENLPDEMIMMILSYVNPLELSMVTSRVCKRWHALISSRIIRIRSSEQYEKLHKGLQVILVTDANPSVAHADTLISYFTRLTPRLRELTINSDFPLDKNAFKSLSVLVHLRHLDVFSKKHVLNRDTYINPGITSLVVNETISNGFFPFVKRNKLSQFHMYGRADHFIPKAMESFLIVQSAYLKDLTLRCSEMSDARFKVLAQCVNLLSLQLYMCSMLTKQGVLSIVSLPALQRLHITGTTLLRTRGIFELVSRLPQHILDLNLSASHFGSEHVDALVDRLPHLRSLELWRSRLDGRGLVKLAFQLLNLEELDTDIEVKMREIDILDQHGELRKLRCRWRGMLSNISCKLILTSSLRVFSGKFLRNCLEGPSAELFYYWTSGITLPQLPAWQEPLFYEDTCDSSDSESVNMNI